MAATNPSFASRNEGDETARESEAARRSREDKELMRRFVAGEESAFTTFYQRFAPGLFSLIFQIVKDQSASEDVLQETFVQMWKRSDTYDPERSNVFTWAVMIGRNKAIDRLRARQRRDRRNEAAIAQAEVDVDTVLQADDLLGRSDERARVRGAIMQLPEAQRQAIELAFFGGMTQAEISDRLQTPLGTIKARIRRGLIALRDYVKPTT